jgi:hypothetical protein
MSKRTKIDFGDDLDDAPPAPIEPHVVKAASARAGFRETASPPPQKASGQAPSASEEKPVVRRGARRRTGRVHQFSTRLSKETLEAIYQYADAEDISLAEVIERAMDALHTQDK